MKKVERETDTNVNIRKANYSKSKLNAYWAIKWPLDYIYGQEKWWHLGRHLLIGLLDSAWGYRHNEALNSLMWEQDLMDQGKRNMEFYDYIALRLWNNKRK